MAKKLGFGPDGLIRARPDPKQKWKAPVNEWVRGLYFKRFGEVLGEKPIPAPSPVKVELDEEAIREFGEQLYWEDYRERNAEDAGPRKRKSRKVRLAKAPAACAAPFQEPQGIGDDDVPF